MLFRIMIIAASATLALTGAGAAGAAIAASPVSPGGTIDGCYTNAAVNGTHAVVLENQGITCPSGTTAVNWNEQGPAGPAGTQGPAGAQGPAGPAGTANVDYGTITISVTYGTGLAPCPNGCSLPTNGYVCTLSSVNGPDAASISAAADPSGAGCGISGLSGGIASLQVTPDGMAPPLGCLMSVSENGNEGLEARAVRRGYGG
jgi:hypothetical protein